MRHTPKDEKRKREKDTHSRTHTRTNMQTNKQKFGGEQLYTGLQNSYFIRRPLLCCATYVQCLRLGIYDCVVIAIHLFIQPSIHPSYILCCTKNFANKTFSEKGSFHSYTHTLVFFSLHLPLSRLPHINSFVHSIHPFSRWLVWSDNR